MDSTPRTIGDLLLLLHERFLAEYGDEELAAVATAAVLNDLLSEQATSPAVEEAA